MSIKKVFYNEVDMVTRDFDIGSFTKMPRTAITPVVRDIDTGYLNAAPYSAGVFSINPFQIIFGVKSWDAKLTYTDANEFTVAVPSRENLDQMWVMACSVPHGINEIELAGLTELESRDIFTPGIKEFPLNLECRVAKRIPLPKALRLIIIADVVGIHISSNILNMSRSDAIKYFPMTEANIENPGTGLYGPGILSGELIGNTEKMFKSPKREVKEGKVYISKGEFFKPINQDILANAIFPMPSYIVMSKDIKNNSTALPVSGGLLMNNRPTIQIPILKDSVSYKNIQENKEFVVSIPIRSQIKNFEILENTNNYNKAGFSLLEGNQIKTKGLVECPINIDCKVVTIEEIPGNNYVLVLGRKVGLSVDGELVNIDNYMKVYSQYIYAVLDKDMVRKWGFHDINNLSVKPVPTWGSRLHGGYWTGPEQYQAGFQYWLIELLQSKYITEEDYHKLRRWIAWLRIEGYWAPEPLRSEIVRRLTEILKMMLWAHRDKEKWSQVHKFFEEYSYEGKWQST